MMAKSCIRVSRIFSLMEGYFIFGFEVMKIIN